MRRIESIFNAVIDMPVRQDFIKLNLVRLKADFWSEPGIWFRLNVPAKYHKVVFGLCIYQWAVGFIFTILSLFVAIFSTFFVKIGIHHFVPKSSAFIPWRDLPNHVAIFIYTIEQILITFVVAWFFLQLVDTIALIYEISESMAKYKGVADMLVPFFSRAVKLLVILTAISLLIKNFGEAESLGRFLAGLGILGIGISLAAQDSCGG